MPEQAKRAKLVARAQDFMNKHTFASHDQCVAALTKEFESFQVLVDLAERRAEDAEARNVFLETEIAALAEKVKK